MKFRGMMLPLLAAALLAPGTVRAQEDDCPCRERRGMIGVSFEAREGGDGVRIIEVRRGSPADRAGVREGDVVIRLNGADAVESFDALPERLQAGDTVRLRIRRDGAEREVAVVAEPRRAMTYTFSRPGMMHREGEPMVFRLDSLQAPLQELTIRIDSLNTHLMRMDTTVFRVQMDSLVHLFNDSSRVFIERMPNVRVLINEQAIDAARLQGELAELHAGTMLLDGERAMLSERPFFMELGRRSAAGAELAELNEGLSAYFGGQREGALVIEVAPETPAARAGLEPGDIIVRAAGEAVEGPDDVRRALNRAEEGRVELEVIRRGSRRELSLEWRGGDTIIHREVRPAPRVRALRRN